MNLVTGGTGFIGQGIVRMLREKGEAVRVFDIQTHSDPSIESIVGDLRDKYAVMNAIKGATTVYHCASLIHVGAGRPQAVYDINVTGTENVIGACVAHGVRKLIYTSSADAVFGDGSGYANLTDESIPYPTKHLSFYGETKSLAEQMVLKANGKQGLLTCAIRPLGVYGEGDRNQAPILLDIMRSKRLIRIGDGSAISLQGYVDNVVHAHWLASERLTPNSPVCGQTYFVGDGAPQNFFDFYAEILTCAGIDFTIQQIPEGLARILAKVSDWLWLALPEGWMKKPLLNEHAVLSVINSFNFSLEKARRELNYAPIVSRQDAIQRTVEALKRQFQESEPVGH